MLCYNQNYVTLVYASESMCKLVVYPDRRANFNRNLYQIKTMDKPQLKVGACVINVQLERSREE